MNREIENALNTLEKLHQIKPKDGGSLTMRQSNQHARAYDAIKIWLATKSCVEIIALINRLNGRDIQRDVTHLLLITQRRDVMAALLDNDNPVLANFGQWALDNEIYRKLYGPKGGTS